MCRKKSISKKVRIKKRSKKMDEYSDLKKETNEFCDSVVLEEVPNTNVGKYFPSLEKVDAAYGDFRQELIRFLERTNRLEDFWKKSQSRIQVHDVMKSILSPLSDIMNAVIECKDFQALHDLVRNGMKEIFERLEKIGVQLNWHGSGKIISDNDKELIKVANWIDINDKSLDNAVAHVDCMGCTFDDETIEEEVQVYRYSEVRQINSQVRDNEVPYVKNRNDNNVRPNFMPKQYSERNSDISVLDDGTICLNSKLELRNEKDEAFVPLSNPGKAIKIDTPYKIDIPNCYPKKYTITFGKIKSQPILFDGYVSWGIYYKNNRYLLTIERFENNKFRTILFMNELN